VLKLIQVHQLASSADKAAPEQRCVRCTLTMAQFTILFVALLASLATAGELSWPLSLACCRRLREGQLASAAQLNILL
jgi:hypothetical protein